MSKHQTSCYQTIQLQSPGSLLTFSLQLVLNLLQVLDHNSFMYEVSCDVAGINQNVDFDSTCAAVIQSQHRRKWVQDTEIHRVR